MSDNFENKPDIKPDIKPKVSVGPGGTSNHAYGVPADRFTDRNQNAAGQDINIKVCDPDGRIWDFTVWNKDPIWKSIITPYAKAANLDSRELRFMLDGERIYSLYADGTWYTPVDLNIEDGDSIDVFKQQDGGDCDF